jgi:hypothetical protein
MDQVMKLKICEACGCIWCRPEGNSGAYCAPCELKLASFPTPESRVRRGRRPSHRGGQLIQVYAVADETGGAQ